MYPPNLDGIQINIVHAPKSIKQVDMYNPTHANQVAITAVSRPTLIPYDYHACGNQAPQC